MLDHDRLFKEVLTNFFVEFIEVFLSPMAEYLDHTSVEFLDKELFSKHSKRAPAEADLVVKAKFKNQQSFFLIHTETQAQPQAGFGKRMFEYYVLLRQKYGLPVYPVVVFSFEQPLATQPCVYEEGFEDLEVLRFQYAVVQLNQMDWRRYEGIKNPVVASFMARMAIAREDRVRVRLKCLNMLGALKLESEQTRIVSSFIDTYLKLTADEQQRYEAEFQSLSPKERERIMELTTSWKEEGIEIGRAQGRAEGRAEGEARGEAKGKAEGQRMEALSIAGRLLVRRLGQLETSDLAPLQDLSVEQLEELSEAVLDFSSKADLKGWLIAHASNAD